MKKRLLSFALTITALLVGILGLYACKSKVEFKVNFVVDGVVYATINTNGQEIIQIPENPTKEDYLFDGWYWDNETWQIPFTANSLLDAPLSSDMSVYCKWKPKTIDVQSVSLNYTTLSMQKGETKTLVASILPTDATDKSISWHSSDTTVASVENGIITAVEYGTATITVTTQSGNKTATCQIEILEDKLIFNTLSVDEENVYGKVSNQTETFSFIKEVTEQGNVSYGVYKEITCETEIKSKSISLTVGDNTVYILQTVGKNLKLYTVTVRRRPMYEITFNTNGGIAVDKQIVEEDSFAFAPTTTKVGYTFTGWDYNFNLPITSHKTITASWSANTNTPYKVEYYLQNLSGSGYTIDNSLTKNLTGTTDKTVYAEIKDIQHFTAEKQQVSGNLNGNGSTVLKVYYTRNSYAVTLTAQGGIVSGVGNYLYNKQITVSATANSGYIFDGWYQGASLISNNASYTFNVTNTVYLTAKFTGVQPFLRTNGTITGLTDYGKTLSALTIPSQIDGITITTIASNAFKNATFTSIIISDNVTSIEGSVFYNCTGLTSVNYTGTIDQWVQIKFGDSYANPIFYTKKLYIKGEEVTSVNLTTATKINDYAFESCESLTSVTMGNSVTSIGSYAFRGCSNLQSLAIGNGVTSLSSGLLSGCGKLQSLTIPFVGGSKTATTASSSTLFGYIFGTSSYTGATAVKQYYASSSYTTYYIPTSLKQVTITGGNILYGAFYNCSRLTSVTIPNSVTSIGNYAFYNCTSLTSITIPNSVTSIGSSAFSGCSNLQSLVIGNGVTTLPSGLLSGCSNLQNLVIGNGITTLSKGLLYGCSNLQSLTIPFVGGSKYATTASTSTLFGYIFGTSSYTGATAVKQYYASGSYSTYYIPTSLKQVTITGGNVLYCAFYNCSSLTSVTIGNSVTSIGESAFHGCTSLTSITIPNSVTSIGTYAFSGCRSLTSVTIPDSVTSIGSFAFYNCTSLQYNIENNLKYLGNSTNPYLYLAGTISTNITTANINVNCKFIRDSAFEDCRGLTSIELPNSVTSIGERAFANCTSLTSVTIPDSVTSIGYGAFYNCSSLTSVTFKNTNGWWVSKDSSATSGTSISSSNLANTSTAARYLKSTYYNYYWKRS